jgi:hypothetical protein
METEGRVISVVRARPTAQPAGLGLPIRFGMSTNLRRIGARIINLDTITSVDREPTGDLSIRFGPEGNTETFSGQEAADLWEDLQRVAKAVDQEAAPASTTLLDDEAPAERVEWFRDDARV